MVERNYMDEIPEELRVSRGVKRWIARAERAQVSPDSIRETIVAAATQALNTGQKKIGFFGSSGQELGRLKGEVGRKTAEAAFRRPKP